MNSLITCYDELSVTFGVITETWLADGKELEDDIIDLQGKAGLGMLVKNRPPNDQGVSHGGRRDHLQRIGFFFHRAQASKSGQS